MAELINGHRRSDGSMTATHMGSSAMEMQDKALPNGDDNSASPSRVGDNAKRLPDQPDTMPAVRPRKLVILHWLTVLCLVMAAVLILTRDQVAGRALRMWLLEGHRHFGLLVLALFLVRVVLRVRLGKWPSVDNSSRLVRLAAGATHVALYALLLTQPLLGWALSGAQGKPVHLLGATLPALVGADEDLADALQVWHQDIAWLLLGLILLHVAAALWHHFVLRDGVLRMMLPQRRG